MPALSALIAANGVTHEVWRGQTITSVSVDPSNPAQLDIGCDIPAAIGGAEIGPFNVTEFAILDATGACCIVGITNLEKTVSSQGQTSDLAWIAAVASGVGQVTLTPPSGGYATMGQVIAAYDASLPGCTAPLTKTDTLQSNGWLYRVFGIAAAAQPADPVSPAGSGAAMGAGRPASAAEWAAGAPTTGGFAWPWPTLQQVAGAFTAVSGLIAALTSSLAGYLLKSGGTMTGALVLAADPTASAQAATKHYVDAAVAAALAGVSGIPTGAVVTFPTPTAPAGWQAADGSLLSRTGATAALWAFAQASGVMAASDAAWTNGGFSPGDGSTTFRIPDARGVFIRGYDNGAGLDGDRAGTLGTYQADSVAAHAHAMGIKAGQAESGTQMSTAAGSGSENTGATGGSETRPKNVNMLVCIKL